MSNPSQNRDPSPSLWEEKERRIHADCRVFTVERRTLRHPRRQTEADFFVVCPADWAVAMAQTEHGGWVMVRQYRFGTEKLMWEFPSGCCEPGEDRVATAARELREEAGYSAGEGIVLGTVEPNPAIQDNRCTFVFFPDARPAGPPDWDDHEEMEIVVMSDTEVRAAARDGRMPHALMHTGLFLYDAWRAEGGSATAGR